MPIHRHKWRHWKDPNGEGPLGWVAWSKGDGVKPQPDGTIGVDRRTCIVCNKMQRFNCMNVFAPWQTISIPQAILKQE